MKKNSITPDQAHRIAIRIYNLRKSQGMTQVQFADAIGVTAVNVSRWENAFRVPSVPAVVAMMDVFGCSANYVLGRTKDERPDIHVPDPDDISEYLLPVSGS